MSPASESTAQPPRIAFYCNLMGWPKRSSGGMRQWVLALANGLVERGHVVDVLTEAPFSRFADEPLLDRRVGRIVLGMRSPLATRRLLRYLRAHPGVRLVAALNAFNLRAARLKAEVGSKAHITVTQHEHLSGDAAWRHRLLHARLTRAVRRDFNRADAVVAVSHGAADDLRERFGVRADRLHAIHNPAFSEDLLVRANEEVDFPWLREKTLPVVMAVGRLHPVKAYDDLLSAFARMLPTTPARLIILGEGRVRAALEAQVAALGLGPHVALPGRVGSVAPWLARADLFVLSSRSEGFGNALIEALACGLRIVSTHCPSGPAEILEQGRYGRMVPVGDIDALARAMAAELAAPPPDRAALLARARHFSLERALDQYLAIWRRAPADA